jgi:hypothetical protein
MLPVQQAQYTITSLTKIPYRAISWDYSFTQLKNSKHISP